MSDGNPKKSKLSWSKKMVTKWFNIKTKRESEDYQADDGVYEGSDMEYRTSISQREKFINKKSKTDKSSKSIEHVQQGYMNLDNPRIVDVPNYSIFVATWNVGGRSPPSNLSLEDWLHASPLADIYVLGFQEIVPLNAGNVLGAEDNGPARKWLTLIRKTLNSLPGTSGVNGCYMPSSISEPVVKLNDDFGESVRLKNSSFFHRQSFHTTNSWRPYNDPSTTLPQLDRRFSISDHVIFDHRPSDCESNFRWGHRLSNYTKQSDHCRQSNYSRPSDYSKWGSSEDDGCPGDSTSDALSSPPSYGSKEDGHRMLRHSRYCLVANKQMVGIFLTIWVRSELKDTIQNLKVSCVGRGLMGYLGNKGSISVSMSLHQTSFCFICSHLTSGQKQGDELRRNSDVMEILKKTRFRCDQGSGQKSPETILEHDRIIWFGDLNYRIALSYRSAKALVEMQNWRALLENDQLRNEQSYGRVFVGWNEGNIYFPPTYKYSNNSDQYSGDGIYKKEKRRTPAWCDRILWYGEGLHQLSYVRGESRFSDHRPVYGLFWAEVQSNHGQLMKSMSSSSRIDVEELLPYSHGDALFPRNNSLRHKPTMKTEILDKELQEILNYQFIFFEILYRIAAMLLRKILNSPRNVLMSRKQEVRSSLQLVVFLKWFPTHQNFINQHSTHFIRPIAKHQTFWPNRIFFAVLYTSAGKCILLVELLTLDTGNLKNEPINGIVDDNPLLLQQEFFSLGCGMAQLPIICMTSGTRSESLEILAQELGCATAKGINKKMDILQFYL